METQTPLPQHVSTTDVLGIIARPRPLPGEPLVVTVAGEFGAGGEEVGAYLAALLGIPCYTESDIQPRVARSQSETSHAALGEGLRSAPLEGWLHRLIKGKELRAEMLHLIKVITELAAGGGVIVCSGAHLILGHRPLFRLKVEGSESYCVQRLAEKEAISPDVARARVRQRNTSNLCMARELYRSFPTDNTYYDLVLNAEALEARSMARLARLALQNAGYGPSPRMH